MFRQAQESGSKGDCWSLQRGCPLSLFNVPFFHSPWSTNILGNIDCPFSICHSSNGRIFHSQWYWCEHWQIHWRILLNQWSLSDIEILMFFIGCSSSSCVCVLCDRKSSFQRKHKANREHTNVLLYINTKHKANREGQDIFPDLILAKPKHRSAWGHGFYLQQPTLFE